MKTFPLFILSLLAVLPFASLEAKKDDASAGDDSKNKTTIIEVEATLDQAHEAALLSLAKIGCNIKKDSPTSIEAKRPNKVGLAVGSGGEILFVTLDDLKNGYIKVTVRTKKTVVGLVGQKLWNDELAADIAEQLKASS